MTDAMTVESANALLPELFAPWVQDLDLTIEEVGDEVVMRMRFDDRLCRVGGMVCGQALMAMADTCMVFVVSAAIGGYRDMATVSQSSSFFRPAINADVIARGRALKSGRTLVFGEVTLFADGDDRAIAHATSTYALPQRG